MSPVVAGIVSFNPDQDLLRSNVSAISGQVDAVLIVDNGSARTPEIELASAVIANVENRGLSKALNQAMVWGARHGADYVLLLDQDSVASPGMVAALTRVLSTDVGAAAPVIVERELGASEEELPVAVDYAITSGLLVRVSAWEAIGGFDEAMFIDFVDFDFAIRLRMAGFRILRTPVARLSHRIGEAKRRGSIISYGHSAVRSFHIGHDMVYYARKHRRAPQNLKVRRRGLLLTYAVLARKGLIIVLFEEDRWRRVSALARGAIAGTFARIDSPTARSSWR